MNNHVSLDYPFKWSETFLSIEGEGPYAGTPTVYVRLVGCNFECKFNMNKDEEITNEKLGFDPLYFHSISDLPTITIGCDSIYSWDMRFSHMWKRGTADDIVNELIDHLPDDAKTFFHNQTRSPYFVSITGGEPILHWKVLPQLINHLELSYVPKLIETNGSFNPDDVFWDDIWQTGPEIIWSISPKLPTPSKIPLEESINVDFIRNVKYIADSSGFEYPYYLKFVISNEKDLKEVFQVLEIYDKNGLSFTGSSVFLMPEGCVKEQQNNVAETVAELAIKHGLKYSHRVHLDVYGNAIGK